MTEVLGSKDYSAVELSYARNGRAVAFALGETWRWDREPEHAPTDYHVTWAREFRYDGARQRYLNRQLDAEALEAGTRVALSDVWSDYDGNAIYGDFEIDGGEAVDVRSFEPGLGTVDWLGGQPDTSTAKYYHTNMIGTTRFMSDAPGSAVESSVYTAFGERIDGTNHRYGYAGSWGYQAHDEMPFLHVGHRYYDPATGRFLQRDPIGIDGGLTVYLYPLRPTVRIDPDGLVAADYPTNPTPGADWLRPPPKQPKGSPGWKIKRTGWVPKPAPPPKLPWWKPSFRFGPPQVTACVVVGAAGLGTGYGISRVKVKKKRISQHIGDLLVKVCPGCWNW